MDQPSLTSLIHIGLTEKQAALYLSLLSFHQAPVSTLATRARMNRSVAYSVLKELIELGYVIESKQTGVKHYSAIDPLKIFHNAHARVENFKFMLPLLRAMHHQGQKRPHVEFFEGTEAAIRVYQTFDTAQHRRIMTAMSHMEQLFSHEFKRWMKRSATVPHPSPTQFLLCDEPIGRLFAQSLKHQKDLSFQFLPKTLDFSMDLVIADSTIAITSFDPVFIIVIHSPELAKSASILFDIAWKNHRTEKSTKN